MEAGEDGALEDCCEGCEKTSAALGLLNDPPGACVLREVGLGNPALEELNEEEEPPFMPGVAEEAFDPFAVAALPGSELVSDCPEDIHSPRSSSFISEC